MSALLGDCRTGSLIYVDNEGYEFSSTIDDGAYESTYKGLQEGVNIELSEIDDGDELTADKKYKANLKKLYFARYAKQTNKNIQ